jgi:uncharacterized protein YraI
MFTRKVGQRWWGIVLLVTLLAIASGLLMIPPANAQNITEPDSDQILYIPLIPSGPRSATPAATLVAGDPVYGLLGQLEKPSGRLYTYYLATAENGYFALAGQTPAIEGQIDALARRGDTIHVKVWGRVQSIAQGNEPPLIVVSGILGTEAPIPGATQIFIPAAEGAALVAVVRYDRVNLYSGPGATYARVGSVVRQQVCDVTGRNAARTWLQLSCNDGQQGWIDQRLVNVQGDVTNVPVVTPGAATPTPTVRAAATATTTPIPITGWRAELYNNQRLAGTPVAVVDVPNLNFNWGSSGPSQLPADGFSIRFSRRVSVTPAFYQFVAEADDGVRVWVDDRLIIDAWPADPSQSYSVGQVMTGDHEIRVEYYEQSGLAKVRLNYMPGVDDAIWQASYYYGVEPIGNPAFRQQEIHGQNPLDYNWAASSPRSSALGNDYWSARWISEFPFEGGNFVFRANADDGIRVYLDGYLVLNSWRDGYKELTNRVFGVRPGQHTIEVQYYERSGNASVRLWWYLDSAYIGPQ